MLIRDTSTMDRPVDRAPAFKRRVVVGVAGALLLLVAAAFVVPGVLRWASAERSVDASRLRIGQVTSGALVRKVAVQGIVVAAFRPPQDSVDKVFSTRTKQPGGSHDEVLAAALPNR